MMPRRFPWLPLAVLFLAAPFPATARDDAIASGAGAEARGDTASPALAPAYPATRRLALVETHFGVPVADPYRWLENDVRADPDVRAWIAAENSTTQAYLRSLPGRDALRARMAQLYSYERYGTPRKAGGRYFFTRNSGLQNQSPLYVREGLAGPERLLIDPNRLSADGTVALAQWEPSADGRHLVYATQDAGSDWRTLHVLDVTRGAVLEDEVRWVRYSDLAWTRDGGGFFYSRFPAQSMREAERTSARGQQIWFHAVGTAQSADRKVYDTPGRPELGHRARVSDDGRWLVITSNISTDARHEVTLLSLEKADARPVKLVRGFADEWQFVGSIGDALYFRTTARAPNGRLVLLDAAHPRRRPVEIRAARAQPLVGAVMIGNRMVLAYQVNGQVVAEIASLLGVRLGDVPLPGAGAAAGFSGRPGDPETFFSYSGFTTPPVIYRFNVETGAVTLFAQPHLAFDPADFVTEDVRYPSRDGTLIPMTIIRRRDVVLSGRTAPTLLYGYGGFNVSQTPGFSPTRLAWVEQGGVVAIASLRGGGEFGPGWHDAGRLSNKQNVFDDFIAAAEYLKGHGYTGPDQLAIEGRSNGGLLVGAVVNQRPDLFAAALPAVGVMDMLRFDRFTAGRLWVDDYGRPDREADFRNLLSYSPYHNIREGTRYPAILVTTGESDDRVVPSHSFKYAAALQHADPGDRPHLIRIAARSGHGAGKPIDMLLDEYADSYSFLAYWTGLALEGSGHAARDDGPSTGGVGDPGGNGAGGARGGQGS